MGVAAIEVEDNPYEEEYYADDGKNYFIIKSC